MDLQLLEHTLDELGEPAYRNRQVWRWAAQGAESFDAMTDLPLRPAHGAARRGPVLEPHASSTRLHARDGTVKALLQHRATAARWRRC